MTYILTAAPTGKREITGRIQECTSELTIFLISIKLIRWNPTKFLDTCSANTPGDRFKDVAFSFAVTINPVYCVP